MRKLQNRLQSSQTKASEFYAKKNIEKREKRFEILRGRSDRVEKDIQFSRTYRDGDFPDIEIPRSAVVIPMKTLAKVIQYCEIIVFRYRNSKVDLLFV